jgi:hypothetical protein
MIRSRRFKKTGLSLWPTTWDTKIAASFRVSLTPSSA